jgi:hypothetical protein
MRLAIEKYEGGWAQDLGRHWHNEWLGVSGRLEYLVGQIAVGGEDDKSENQLALEIRSWQWQDILVEYGDTA